MINDFLDDLFSKKKIFCDFGINIVVIRDPYNKDKVKEKKFLFFQPTCVL